MHALQSNGGAGVLGFRLDFVNRCYCLAQIQANIRNANVLVLIKSLVVEMFCIWYCHDFQLQPSLSKSTEQTIHLRDISTAFERYLFEDWNFSCCFFLLLTRCASFIVCICFEWKCSFRNLSKRAQHLTLFPFWIGWSRCSRYCFKALSIQMFSFPFPSFDSGGGIVFPLAAPFTYKSFFSMHRWKTNERE